MHHLLPLGRSQQRDVRIAREACVVHENIHDTERFHGLLEKRRDARFIGNVALTGPRASASRLDACLKLSRWRLAFAIRDAHGGTTVHEQIRDGSTDASRSSGHDGHAAMKEEIGRRFVYHA